MGLGAGLKQAKSEVSQPSVRQAASFFNKCAKFGIVDQSLTIPPMPAEYYVKHAARVRELAREATTEAVKLHLRETALEYERLADKAAMGPPLG
jgi:hypothetical protein